MGLRQCISNAELLDLWQLCEIDEKQYNMGPLTCMFEPMVQSDVMVLVLDEAPEEVFIDLNSKIDQ